MTSDYYHRRMVSIFIIIMYYFYVYKLRNEYNIYTNETRTARIDFNLNNFKNRNLFRETYIFNPISKTKNILFKCS